MKLLLDECTPKRLKKDFVGHDTFTVDESRLKGLRNGALLRAASDEFDVLITVDRHIPFQQNLSSFNIALLILLAPNNRYDELNHLVPRALEALTTIRPGEVVRIEAF